MGDSKTNSKRSARVALSVAAARECRRQPVYSWIFALTSAASCGAWTAGVAKAANDAWATSPGGNSFTGAYWTVNSTTPGAATGTIAPGDVLYFGSSSQLSLTDNEAAAFSIGGFVFNSNASAYTIAGVNGMTLNGGITNNSANLQTISDAISTTGLTVTTTSGGGNVTLSGVISGAGGITTAGSGILTLSNAGNTFAGNTTIGSGTLSINAVTTGSGPQELGEGATVNLGVPGVSSGTLFYNSTSGGTLAKSINVVGNGNDTILAGNGSSALLLTGGITLNGTTLTLKGSTDGIQVRSAISGSSAGSNLIIDGGFLGLYGGTDSYNGSTTVRDGAQAYFETTGVLPTSIRSALIVDPTGSTAASTLNVDTSQSVASVTGPNSSSEIYLPGTSLTVGNSSTASTTYNGIIVGGGGSVVKDGTSTQIFSGQNSYTGTTTVSGGLLQFAQLDSFYNDTASNWTPANVTVASGATLAVNVGGTGEFATTDVTTLLDSSHLGAATASTGLQAGSSIGFDTTNASGGNFTISSTIANTTGTVNSIGVTKLGTNTLTLSGNNTFTGPVSIANGTLSVNNVNTGTAAQPLGEGTSIYLGVAGVSSGALFFNNTSGGTLDKGITAQGNGNDTIQAASGQNPLILTGGISLSGTTLTLKGGTDGIQTYGAITGAAAGSNLIIDGGFFGMYNSGDSYSGSTTITDGAQAFFQAAGVVPSTSAVVVDPAGSTGSSELYVEYNQSIASLTGTNSASSIDLPGTTLTIGASSGNTTFAGAIFGGGTLVKSGASSQTLSGNISSGGVTVNAGNLVLSGSNTYAGATTVSGGALAAGSTTGLSPKSAVVMANTSGAVLNLAGFNNTIGSITGGGSSGGNVSLGSAVLTVGNDNTSPAAYAGIISGTGGITKVGTGVQIFSGANNYSGLTTVSAGTLQVTSTGKIGQLQVQSGGTLVGGGIITGQATINSGGKISPGSTTAGGLITFDDLTPNTNTPIPNGYGGLNWNDFYAWNPNGTSYNTQSSVSAPNYAYDGYGTAATFSSTTPFTLTSFYLSTEFHSPGSSILTAYDGSTLVSTQNLTDPVTPVLQTFNLSGITSVTITPQVGDVIAIDNLSINGGTSAQQPQKQTYSAALNLNGGGTYICHFASAGTSAPSTNQNQGIDWDDVTANTLSVTSGGSSASFIIQPVGTLTNVTAGTYSWIIAEIAGTTTITNQYGSNLLAGSGSQNAPFVLDLSQFSINGGESLSTTLTLASASGGGEDLVLTAVVPEPGTMSILLAGGLMVLRRRRHAR